MREHRAGIQLFASNNKLHQRVVDEHAEVFGQPPAQGPKSANSFLNTSLNISGNNSKSMALDTHLIVYQSQK